MKITHLNPSGAYGPVQDWPHDTPPDGYTEITADTTEFFNGFIVPIEENGVIVSFTENVSAHKSWTDAEAAKPAPAPSEGEQLRADVDYLAAMAGVEL